MIFESMIFESMIFESMTFAISITYPSGIAA